MKNLNQIENNYYKMGKNKKQVNISKGRNGFDLSLDDMVGETKTT